MQRKIRNVRLKPKLSVIARMRGIWFLHEHVKECRLHIYVPHPESYSDNHVPLARHWELEPESLSHNTLKSRIRATTAPMVHSHAEEWEDTGSPSPALPDSPPFAGQQTFLGVCLGHVGFFFMIPPNHGCLDHGKPIGAPQSIQS